MNTNVIRFQTWADGGAEMLVSVGPFTFAAFLIAGAPKLTRISGPSGFVARPVQNRAPKMAESLFMERVRAMGDDFMAANVALYA